MRLTSLLVLVASSTLTQCSHQEGDPMVLVEHKRQLPKSSNRTWAALDLIDVREVDPTIAADLWYKKDRNVTRKPLYASDFPPLLRPGTATRLAFANRLLAPQGYHLMIWDAYRPPEVQRALFEASGRNDRYVANPDRAPSQHSCGTAVDVTLIHRDGREAKMPTGMDEFSKAAASDFRHPDPEVRKNLKALQDAMRDAGFYPLAAEWWHYIDRDYKSFPETISIPE